MEHPKPKEDPPVRPYVRPREPLDFITECPSLVFWVVCYLPVGVLTALIFNSVAPLVIALCLAYLTNQSLD